MTAASPVPAPRDRYWMVPLARAFVALVAAAVITFTADHSAVVGLWTFGGFTLASGLIVGIGGLLVADRAVRVLFIGTGIFGVIVGVTALAVHDGGLGVFLYTVSVWAALTGFCELYCGIRVRRQQAVGRDWIVVGALTIALALVFLLIPADAVLAVGLFGAYAAVLTVYLGIGGFSLKWAAQHPEPAVQEGAA